MSTLPITDENNITTDSESRRYPFQAIERKWQARWAESGVYRTIEGGAPHGGSEQKPKYYVLDMFPYPSGSGLHVGHCKNYIPGDVVARLMHMRGSNVLHPMGWDAFGQPAEQDAIKKGVNPRQVVPLLAREFRRQMSLMGIGYDWDREINSTDAEYYRWNQWAFLLLLKRGLAYRSEAPVNWCVNENTVLANEEVNDNRCWRCDGPVIKKSLPQWFFKITAYGDKLIEGLNRIQWPEGVKTQQRDWIGRSEGCEFDLAVENQPESKIRVFTTRVDTVFGMSFVVLSPEHPLVVAITTDAQLADVEAYRAQAARMSELERTAENRERTGVFTGAHAINPLSGHRVPVYIADYVLAGYGTGAIMAVPAHDTRDFDFARRYHLPTPVVIARSGDEDTPLRGEDLTAAFLEKDNGITVNSGQFSGLPCKIAAHRITEWMESEGIGVGKVNFRLRDWLVSRQRYWGTPIPIIHCPSCGIVPVPEDQLPVVLPDVENYRPGPDGRSPLAQIPEFVNTTCPQCGGPAERETDTMAGSVDSSWYFLRFTSPHDNTAAWNRAAADYWMAVDRYIGGREHAVGHLLYARFFTKVFFDAGFSPVDEPFQTLRNQGMLLGLTTVDVHGRHPIKPDEFVGYDRDTFLSRWTKEGVFTAERRIQPEGEPERVEPVSVAFEWLKMSKSKGNAVTPDEIAERYGADALRTYVLFEAPFEDTIQWSEERMVGAFRFLNRVWDTVTDAATVYQPDWSARLESATSADERALRRRTHQTIAKLTDDLAEFRFNTAVSSLMIHADALRKFVAANGATSPAAQEAADALIKLLAPIAPHIADELWERLGYAGAFLYNESWPVSDAAVAAEDEITLVVQINGKLRERFTLPADADAKVCEMAALQSEKIKSEIDGKTIRKIIVIPGKLVNIVVG